MYSQEKKNQVQISRHLTKMPVHSFTIRLLLLLLLFFMYTCNLKANTYMCLLLFTAIGDPFYYLRMAVIFILFVFIIYLFYIFCQIYRQNIPGSHLGIVTRIRNLDSVFQRMLHMNFGFADWPRSFRDDFFKGFSYTGK